MGPGRAMIRSTCFGDESDGALDVSRKVASSESPRRRFEMGLLGTRTMLLVLFAAWSDPVEVDLLGHMLRRPKTALNRPQPDFLSGDSSISCKKVF